MFDTPEAAALEVKRLLALADPEWERLKRLRDYFRGKHDEPYAPRTATDEYKALRKRATTNLMPLIVRGVTQRLYVDGYRPSEVDDTDDPVWAVWQANGMDLRQKALFEAAGTYGYAYCSTLPDAESQPVIRPRSPLTWFCEFEDEAEDVWPKYAIRLRGRRVTLVDADGTYAMRRPRDGDPWQPDLADPANEGSWITPHRVIVDGEPVCPFRIVPVDVTLDDKPQGDVEPHIPMQDRLNQTVFDLLLAQTYSSTKVRVITGMTPPDAADKPGADEYEDDDPQTAEQVTALEHRKLMAAQRSPLELAVDKLLMLESTDASATTLPESNLEQLISAIGNCLRIFGLASQTPPHDLLGEIVNVSGDGLQAAEMARGFKVADRKVILGEAVEDILAAAASIGGFVRNAEDKAAQVIWRDTDPRSFGAVVDALGKLAQMLDVPVEWLWSKIPGVTQTDIGELRRLVSEEDPIERARRQLEADTADTAPLDDNGVPGDAVAA